MNIAIDARFISQAGFGTYLRELLPRLIASGKAEFILLGDPDVLAATLPPGPWRARSFRSRMYAPLEQLTPLFRARGADLYHAPHYDAPLLWNGPMVVTVHDTAHLSLPQLWPGLHFQVYARTVLRAACRRARRVLTVSEFSKGEIVRHTGTAPEKIRVVPNGVSSRFTPEPQPTDAEIRGAYGLVDGYVLYAGNVKPHKNVQGLVRAYALMRRRKHANNLLVIAGETRGFISRLEDPRDLGFRSGFESDIRFIGPVLPAHLPALYRGASVFAFPSFYEGFGLPPLEAMACGVPCVVSDRASLPEVCGDAALQVNPDDNTALADALERLLTDAALRDALALRGLSRARSFSWDRAATAILETYAQALA